MNDDAADLLNRLDSEIHHAKDNEFKLDKYQAQDFAGFLGFKFGDDVPAVPIVYLESVISGWKTDHE